MYFFNLLFCSLFLFCLKKKIKIKTKGIHVRVAMYYLFHSHYVKICEHGNFRFLLFDYTAIYFSIRKRFISTNRLPT